MKNNWRNKKERSKVVISMGRAAGIKAERWGQRGIIFKTVLPRVEAWEDFEFKKLLKPIKFNYIKVTDLNGQVSYI